MRVGIVGGGSIAQLFCEHIARGELGDAEVIAILGRASSSRARALAQQHRVAFMTDVQALIGAAPAAVVEAAAHAWVEAHAERVLAAGIGLIVLSAGAMADDLLRARLERAARASGALLYVPSGGIGALDAIKAAAVAGLDEVTLRTAKPPRAWQGIDYVRALGIDLAALTEAYVLYDGPARAGVKHFPQNVNIAAALSMAGIGFDRTRLVAVADPHIVRNTHVITARGVTGEISITLENVPCPENPKTAWLACYSALAALKAVQSPVRYGT
ncbi:MAG: aspartate dehydrogenase [Burkholderiales bacterium]|nr:aspartate dehydrogenase [Burkholderiales bacterium]